MNKDKFDYIYNYVMDDIEITDATTVVNVVNALVSRKIEVGNPEITSDYTQGYKAGTLKVVEINLVPHYCFFTVDEKGCIDCIVINERMACEGYMSSDVAVYFILMHIGIRNIRAYHIHEGHLVRAVKCRGGKIRLKQIIDYGKQTLNDAARHAIGNGEPIYDAYKCTCGSTMFYVKDETVGMDCPYCKTHIRFEV